MIILHRFLDFVKGESRSHWRTTPETHRTYRTALYVFLRFLEESDTSTFVVCPNLSSALLLLSDHGKIPPRGESYLRLDTWQLFTVKVDW